MLPSYGPIAVRRCADTYLLLVMVERTALLGTLGRAPRHVEFIIFLGRVKLEEEARVGRIVKDLAHRGEPGKGFHEIAVDKHVCAPVAGCGTLGHLCLSEKPLLAVHRGGFGPVILVVAPVVGNNAKRCPTGRVAVPAAVTLHSNRGRSQLIRGGPRGQRSDRGRGGDEQRRRAAPENEHVQQTEQTCARRSG